jgi:hypothetical protein
MFNFLDFITEADEDGSKLKHIHHAEDRPLLHGEKGFEHAVGALYGAHHHTLQGLSNNKLTMKYDGSPSIVFGHHPENGKFFVASKSAFNKNPKLNYNENDIEQNHGHAAGLVDKLKSALNHLPKVAPKSGVYQGDLMYTHDDLKHHDDGDKVSFTPNTITYTAKGDKAAAIKKSKMGVVIHTKYEGDTLSKMSAHHDVHPEEFGQHPDVFHHTAAHDSKQTQYSKKAQDSFHQHMSAAKQLHYSGGSKMYKATEPHHGDGNHLATYINQTVRTGEEPSVDSFKEHIANKYKSMVSKLKTEKSQNAKLDELRGHVKHIEKNRNHYGNLLKMHGHLQSAKNELVKSLESNEGSYEHAIGGQASKPEGFVYSHTHEGKTEPTKLVNRAEFARQNLLKSRQTAPKDVHHVIAFGRMNPPTAGHEQVVNTLKDKAKQVGGDHTLILSHSHGTKDNKNPLNPEQKLTHARNAFPGTNIQVASKDKPTLLHHAVDLYNKGVTHLHFSGGSDRQDMADMLRRYNGVKSAHGYYNFKDVQFHSSGEREEGAKGIAGISGTKLRELASSGKKKEFHSNLSSQMKPEHKDDLYNDLRKAMK